MPYHRLITEIKLENWVSDNPQKARSLIVELIDRLVAASISTNDERHFPKNIDETGADGVVKTEKSPCQYVPGGISFWEIGTNKNPSQKFKDDIAKYHDEHRLQGCTRSESTFVFVTPRLSQREKLTQKYSNLVTKGEVEGDWKDVVIIDADRLSDWMAEHLAVTYWFGRETGIVNNVDAVSSLYELWDLFERKTNIHECLSELFLEGRDAEEQRLNQFFDDDKTILRINLRQPEQLPCFIASAVQKRDDADFLNAKILVISSEETFRNLCPLCESQIFILTFSVNDELPIFNLADNYKLKVIFSKIPLYSAESTGLKEVDDRVIMDVCLKNGILPKNAFTYAKQSLGNPFNLQYIMHDDTLPIPTKPLSLQNPKILISLCLIGGWDEESEADKDFIEKVTGGSYGDFVSSICGILNTNPHLPVVGFSPKWKVTQKLELWKYCLAYVSTAEIVSFCDRAVDLFDYRNTPSPLLKECVAETLVFLSSNLSPKTHNLQLEIPGIIENTISRILADFDVLKLSVVSSVLPSLAEAAPRCFLDTINKLFSSQFYSDINQLSENTNDYFWEQVLQPIAQSLERLAWSNAHFSRAVLSLAKIAEIELKSQGYFLYHRSYALNSLQTIFWIHHPQTYANHEKIRAILKKIVKETPKTGEALLLIETGNSNTICYCMNYPIWNDDFYGDSIQTNLYLIFHDILVETWAESPALLETFTTNYLTRVGEIRHTILSYLEEIDESSLPDELRRNISVNLLRALSDIEYRPVSKHYPQEERESLRNLVSRYSNRRFVYQYVPLFGDRCLDFRLGVDISQHRNAIAEIYQEDGLSGILELAELVNNSRAVGYIFGESSISEDESIFPSILHETGKQEFLCSYIAGRFRMSGESWVKSLNMDTWSSEEKSLFFISLPYEKEIWEMAENTLGDDCSLYWEKTGYIPRDSYADFYRGMLNHKRGLEAVRTLGILVSLKKDINPEIIKDVLCSLSDDEILSSGLPVYEIILLFNLLSQSSDITDEVLIELEIRYFSLLSQNLGEYKPRFYQRLADSPEYFCSILEMSKTDAWNKQISWALFHWNVVPGMKTDGLFHEEFFRFWILDVLDFADSHNLRTTASIYLGRMLVHSPSDSSGLWIHKAAADVLDAAENYQLLENYTIHLFNSDYAHIYDEGKWECDRAEECKSRAESLDNDGFFNFADAMRKLAESYCHSGLWSRKLFEEIE